MAPIKRRPIKPRREPFSIYCVECHATRMFLPEGRRGWRCNVCSHRYEKRRKARG